MIGNILKNTPYEARIIDGQVFVTKKGFLKEAISRHFWQKKEMESLGLMQEDVSRYGSESWWCGKVFDTLPREIYEKASMAVNGEMTVERWESGDYLLVVYFTHVE